MMTIFLHRPLATRGEAASCRQHLVYPPSLNALPLPFSLRQGASRRKAALYGLLEVGVSTTPSPVNERLSRVARLTGKRTIFVFQRCSNKSKASNHTDLSSPSARKPEASLGQAGPCALGFPRLQSSCRPAGLLRGGSGKIQMAGRIRVLRLHVLAVHPGAPRPSLPEASL